MIDLTLIHRLAEERTKVLSWLIHHGDANGLSVKDSAHISWDLIVRTYNVNDFPCEHVGERWNGGLTESGRPYNGFCTACNKSHVLLP